MEDQRINTCILHEYVFLHTLESEGTGTQGPHEAGDAGSPVLAVALFARSSLAGGSFRRLKCRSSERLEWMSWGCSCINDSTVSLLTVEKMFIDNSKFYCQFTNSKKCLLIIKDDGDSSSSTITYQTIIIIIISKSS